MSPLRLARFAVIAAPLAFLFGACSSSRSSGNSSSNFSDGGAGGSGGVESGASTSMSSAMELDGGASDGSVIPTGMCYGDEPKWEMLTSGPIACVDDAECCVIMSPCKSDAQIVAAEHMEEALKVWPHCTLQCTDCVAPAVDVACIQGQCLGHIFQDPQFKSDLRKSHCGTDTKLAPSVDMTGTHFECLQY